MPSPYRIQSNTNKRKQKISNDISNKEHEPKVNSNEPKRAQKDLIICGKNTKFIEINRNDVKGGANIEINEKYLNEIVHNYYL